MKKRLIPVFSFCILYSAASFAQRLSPSILSSGGGINQLGSIQLAWSLGEPMVETLNSQQKLFTQGFHQPTIWAGRSMVKEDVLPPLKNFMVKVNPNPVQSILHVNIQSDQAERLVVNLYDMQGQPLFSRSIAGESSLPINMQHLSAGVYILQVIDRTGTLLNSFRVVKMK